MHHFKAISEFKLKLQETLNSGQNGRFFAPCALIIWWITLKNNRAPLLCCFKLCASFHSHRWIETKVTVWKSSIRVKIGDLLSRVTFKFDGWPWKTIGHLFYVAWSFMHHFITISEFKLKLQSGNVQFEPKSAIFCPIWPWNLTNADWPTPDPPQTIRFMIWNHTISLQTIQFSDQTIQFYYKPYNCLSNHLKHELGKYIIQPQLNEDSVVI